MRCGSLVNARSWVANRVASVADSASERTGNQARVAARAPVAVTWGQDAGFR